MKDKELRKILIESGLIDVNHFDFNLIRPQLLFSPHINQDLTMPQYIRMLEDVIGMLAKELGYEIRHSPDQMVVCKKQSKEGEGTFTLTGTFEQVFKQKGKK